MMLQKIKNLLNTKLNVIKYFFLRHPIIYNVNKANENVYKKRALFVYQTTPFLLKEDDSLLLQHHSLKQALQIAKVIGSFSYIVDVADYRDEKYRTNNNYDLIISHNVNSRINKLNLNKDCKIIYLSSGMYHILHNKLIKARYDSLFERRKVKILPKRLASEKISFLDNVECIIGFGNEYILNTWGKIYNKPIFTFNNYGYKGTKYNIDKKNFDLAKKNYLFFSGGDMVWKGLDLLLEIFPKHPELHLYICADYINEKDFKCLYRKELFDTPNIHPIGYIRPNSNEYEQVVNKCAYIIHPSATDGQPGGVIQCMNSGLIPIISKECGINIGDEGIILNNCSIEEIEATLLQSSNRATDWLIEKSKTNRDLSNDQYSEDAFIKRWESILNSIMMNNRS
jgi:glycosyltransferase involved in cell wall biosynthesis